MQQEASLKSRSSLLLTQPAEHVTRTPQGRRKVAFCCSCCGLQGQVGEQAVLTEAEEESVNTHCIDAEEPMCNQVGANDDCLQKHTNTQTPNSSWHQCSSVNTRQKPSLITRIQKDFKAALLFCQRLLLLWKGVTSSRPHVVTPYLLQPPNRICVNNILNFFEVILKNCTCWRCSVVQKGYKNKKRCLTSLFL